MGFNTERHPIGGSFLVPVFDNSVMISADLGSPRRAASLRGLASRVILAAVALVAHTAHAQTIRGYVRDSATNEPIARAQVTVKLSTKDSAIATTLSSDSGTFVLKLKAPGTFTLQAKRLGWSPLMTSSFPLQVGDSLSLTFDLGRHATALDTVVTVETRGVFAQTPGKEYVRKHFALGVGLIVSGWEIEQTGLSLSEYLGKQAGIGLSQAWAPLSPIVPASDQRGLTSDFSSGCLIARIDRQSVLYMLMTQNGRWVDDVLKVKDVMAVEIYLDRTEVPKEWAMDARPDLLYGRNWTDAHGAPNDYTIAHIGLPPPASILADDSASFGTMKITGGSRFTTGSAVGVDVSAGTAASTIGGSACGFMQIWTGTAWGG